MKFRRGDISCFFVAMTPLLTVILSYLLGCTTRNIGTVFLLAVAAYFAVICFVLLDVAWNVKQIFAGRFQARNALVLALAVAVFSLSMFILPPPGVVFVRGFMDRVERTITPEGMMKIAAVARQYIPDGEMVWFKTSPWGRESDNGPAREALSALPEFALLPPDFTISHNRGIVNLSWGGALPGHWGFRCTEGNILSRGDRDYFFKPLRENLAVYHSD